MRDEALTNVVDVVIPVNVASPSLVKVTPLPTSIPFRAVISPTESMFVTSSYVNVPAIETVPPIETSLTKFTVPPTERTLSEAFNVAIVVTPAN